MSAAPELLVFGYVSSAESESGAASERVAQFCLLVGGVVGVQIAVCQAASYEELALMMHRGEVDLAWLPPIPFIALERRDEAVALVANHRDGAGSYRSVLIVSVACSVGQIADLRGKRAAWVDPHSASGFVIPRIELFRRGVDPRTAFGAEQFCHSHEGVVRALVEGHADFGGTYGGADPSGNVVRGPWLDVPGSEDSLRVLASFGSIPSDVIAARRSLPDPLRDRVVRALILTSRDKTNHLLIRDVFGVDEFRRFVPAGYEALRRATEEATAQGLLEGPSG